MTDINSVILVGRLTKDCGAEEGSFVYTQGGLCMARISIAVNRAKKQQDGTWVDEASFFNVTIFGKTAENLKPYLLRGKQIMVQGHLSQNRWRDQQGQAHSSVSVIADNVQLARGGQSQGNGVYQKPAQQGYTGNQTAPRQQYQQQQAPQYEPPQDFGMDEFPEDIPF